MGAVALQSAAACPGDQRSSRGRAPHHPPGRRATVVERRTVHFSRAGAGAGVAGGVGVGVDGPAEPANPPRTTTGLPSLNSGAFLTWSRVSSTVMTPLAASREKLSAL